MELTKKSILIVHADTPAGQAACQAALRRNLTRILVTKSNVPSGFLLSNEKSFTIDTHNETSVRQLALELDKQKIAVNYLVTCPLTIAVNREEESQKPFEQMSRQEWDGVFGRDFYPAVLFCQVFGERMRLRGFGRIIQMASNVATDPYRPQDYGEINGGRMYHASAAYACAMAAVMALTKHLAVQYQDCGVLINNLVYGPLAEAEPLALVKAYPNRVPLGRVMTIQDLAQSLDLLLDPKTNYITGQNIVSDGGVAVW